MGCSGKSESRVYLTVRAGAGLPQGPARTAPEAGGPHQQRGKPFLSRLRGFGAGSGKPLAAKAGLGWIGKHSNLLTKDAGSWYFLGEIYTDLELRVDTPASAHCGVCTNCIKACPTGAIVEPGVVDSRLCISYLTIELKGAIPESLRPALGNRIYGCDDCQLVCPFNKFSTPTREQDFAVRHGLDSPTLVDLFGWDEATFLSRFEGSAIRRIGHERWLRNIAVALGNGPATPAAIGALKQRENHPSELVREHVAWSMARLTASSQPA